MKLKKVWAVYFSGTGTTRRTVERIACRCRAWIFPVPPCGRRRCAFLTRIWLYSAPRCTPGACPMCCCLFYRKKWWAAVRWLCR